MSKATSPDYPETIYGSNDKELLEEVAERDDDIGDLAEGILEEVEFDA